MKILISVFESYVNYGENHICLSFYMNYEFRYFGGVAMRGPSSGYPVRPMLVPGQSSHHPALGIPLHMGK